MIAPGVDVLVVVGSPSSSNSNRLRELAERLGADAYMVDSPRATCAPSGSQASAASASPPARRRRRSWSQAGGREAARARRDLGAQHSRARSETRALSAAHGPGRQVDARRAELSSDDARATCALEGGRLIGCDAVGARERRRRLTGRRRLALASQPSQPQPEVGATECLRRRADDHARGQGQASTAPARPCAAAKTGMSVHAA